MPVNAFLAAMDACPQQVRVGSDAHAADCGERGEPNASHGTIYRYAIDAA